ncbi:DUF669 domain-containing protein [Mammaliicoccus vitulinus]|uniref:DUF669 domain-containing protein n=1 Tax=Mammaliicoccus vitulinus TaxID=71237 RepID=UPI00248CAC3D|nr:DUF669 domain-containing protein [Mammaliicoccus vitulinus]
MLNFEKPSSQYTLIEKGEYEFILTVEWKQTKNHDSFINCAFKIRKDVPQQYGGQIVFDGIYKNKTTGEYSRDKINHILGTIPNAKYDFESYDELIQYINGIKIRATVDIQESDNYPPKNVIVYLSYKETNYPESKTDAVSESNNNGDKNVEKLDISDDDLPF